MVSVSLILIDWHSSQKKKNKTNWKDYQEAIKLTKLLGYTQAEADYLVYEYFVIIQKCPVPEPGEIERAEGGIFTPTPPTKNVSDEELFGSILDNAVKNAFR